ncbi:MAG: helix-turn-helix domain-containing protein [Acholeplasmataceae bacterium]|nr:helix-turn-helix domain-containing protein [Acholeplasmataceae bacterium]
MSISENIKILRLQKNMTQKELGDSLHITDKTISKWENGRSVPDIYMIKKIAIVFDVNYEIIVEGQAYNQKNKNIGNLIKCFISENKKFVVLSIILISLLIALSFLPPKIALFVGILAATAYIIYLMISTSKWYIISLLVILIEVGMLTDNYFDNNLGYIVILLIFVTLILIGIRTFKFKKNRDIHVEYSFLGNWNIIIASIILIIAFKVEYKGQINDVKMIVSRYPYFYIYMLAFIGLIILNQYFLNNRVYREKVILFIKRRILIVIVSTLVIVTLSTIGVTGLSLAKDHVYTKSIYAWKSYYRDDFTSEQINELNSTYGEDNVTLFRYVEVTTDLQVYAYTSNFIDNGVIAFDIRRLTHIEKPILLYGKIWNKDSNDKVVVIDKDTAINQFGKVNVVGKDLMINNQKWDIIGVVSNTTSAKANIDRAISNGIDPSEIQSDSYVYVPYYFKDFEAFEIAEEKHDAFIINTQKLMSTKKDANPIIDILVDGNNYDSDFNYGDRLIKIGITTGSDVVYEYLSLRKGLLLSTSLLVIFIGSVELLPYVKRSKSIFPKKK